MIESIKSMNFNANIKKDELYNILKSNSRKINDEINQKIDSFSTIQDFLNYYSNNESKQLLNLINNNNLFQVNNNDNFLSSLESDVEKYISSLIQIIFAIKLVLKIQNSLNKILYPSKKFLETLKMKKQLESKYHKNIFINLKSILKFPSQKKRFHESSSIITTSIHSFRSQNNFKITSFNKFLSNNIFINPPEQTPKFKDIDETIKEDVINKKKIQKKIMSFRSNSSKSLDSEISFKDMSFNNNNNLLCRKKNPNFSVSDNTLINVNKSFTGVKFNKNQINQIKERNYPKRINSCFLKECNTIELESLLEMIKTLYKKGLINSEEKIKLKRLVIKKSEKIINFYYDVYQKANLFDNQKLLNEIKKTIYTN